MIRRPPRSTQGVSSAASDVYKRQNLGCSRQPALAARARHHALFCGAGGFCTYLVHTLAAAAMAVVAQTSPRPPLMREACESCTSRADVSRRRRSKLAHVLRRTSARVSATDGISWPLRAASGTGGAGAWLWSRRRGEARALRRFSGRERPVDSVEARRTTRASFDRGKRSVSTSCTWI